jgi:S1/P1 Nuclease
MEGSAMRDRLLFSIALSVLPVATAEAWWDEGHMQIAYVAYKRLDAAVKDNADALLRLNPDYPKWTAAAPDAETAKRDAFVHAATWADDIKTPAYAYKSDDVHSATAGQNIGYADHNQHAYWHFKDILYSPDRTPLPSPDPVDAVTQVKIMMSALPPSSGASDDVRSYDLVWLLHLVGDLHQPLHAISRYTVELSGGDAGGNAETVIPATGETIALHAYWDRMFGGYSSPAGAVFDADEMGGLASLHPNAAQAETLDPEIWAQESAAAAKQYAYARPVGAGPSAVMLTREYETNAPPFPATSRHSLSRREARR